MQVRGLPREIIRNGCAASRLLAANTPNIEAERRRDGAARERRTMANGLTAEQAAQAVGAPRSTLYRWEKSSEPRSRRPCRVRQPHWPPALIEAVDAIRADNPMWGKRKIAALVKREGRAVSVSKVGRILRRLVERGVVVPAPILPRRPSGRRFRLDARQRYAKRLAKGRNAKAPGEFVQIDTLFVNVRRTGRSNTSPPTTRSPNGRSATSQPPHPPAPIVGFVLLLIVSVSVILSPISHVQMPEAFITSVLHLNLAAGSPSYSRSLLFRRRIGASSRNVGDAD